MSSLADRVQQQTGIPYLLLDGAFDRMPRVAAPLGDAARRDEARGDASRATPRRHCRDVDAPRRARARASKRPRVYYARGPRGLETGLAGSINIESIERLGARNVAAATGRGGLVQVSLEQVLALEPRGRSSRSIRTSTPSRARDPLWRGRRAVAAGRVYCRRSQPFGWIDFPPVGQPADRPALARPHPLSRRRSPRTCDAVVREFYTPLLPPGADRGAARRAARDARTRCRRA